MDPWPGFSTRWTVAAPPEGLDLVIAAHWPDPTVGPAAGGATPSAARLTVRYADGRQVEKTFWTNGTGALTDVFTVPCAPTTTAP